MAERTWMPLHGPVAIVGVGLIGASIGLAMKDRGLCERIIGIARRRETLDVALRRGAIDTGATAIGPEIAAAELAIVCTPVGRIAEDVLRTRDFISPRAIVCDAGSTKARIVERIPSAEGAAEFVGSHPLAGSHLSGPEAAAANLFNGRVCVVTPTDANTETAVVRIIHFWESLGMNVVTMPAESHDAIVARTSHLPHVAAFALAHCVSESDLTLAGTGFRDTTRLAASRPELWSDIFRQNREAVLDAIDRYLQRLGELRDAIAKGEPEEVERLLADAKRIREALGN